MVVRTPVGILHRDDYLWAKNKGSGLSLLSLKILRSISALKSSRSRFSYSFTALKIHISSDTKSLLDHLGGYHIQERGEVFLKVHLDIAVMCSRPKLTHKDSFVHFSDMDVHRDADDLRAWGDGVGSWRRVGPLYWWFARTRQIDPILSCNFWLGLVRDRVTKDVSTSSASLDNSIATRFCENTPSLSSCPITIAAMIKSLEFYRNAPSWTQLGTLCKSIESDALFPIFSTVIWGTMPAELMSQNHYSKLISLIPFAKARPL